LEQNIAKMIEQTTGVIQISD